jgi:hypothetical protein
MVISILIRLAGGFRWGLAAVLLFAASLPAQQFRATVTGSVTDPSGAAVPKGEGRRGLCGMHGLRVSLPDFSPWRKVCLC